MATRRYLTDENIIFCGTWKIVKCWSNGLDTFGVEGCEFTLEESGDVTWKIPPNVEALPLFNCETFESFSNNPRYLRFFGSSAGHVMEFKVQQSKEGCIKLTYEGWWYILCEKVLRKASGDELPYSFFSALEEGFFYDIIIKSKSKKEYKLHHLLLELANPRIDWRVHPTPLEYAPDKVLKATLHYLYCECLPPDMNDEIAKACIDSVAKIPGFEKFGEQCKLFLKNSSLKTLITGMINDMQLCTNHIEEYFLGKGENEHLTLTVPSKLCFIIRQSLRELAIAGAKCLLLCGKFTQRKRELSKEEVYEIMRHCRSKVPLFINQLRNLLEKLQRIFKGFSEIEKVELAKFLVPEISIVLETMVSLKVEAKSVLEHLIKGVDLQEAEDEKIFYYSNVLKQELRKVLRVRELLKLRSLHDRVSFSLLNLVHKQQHYNSMSASSQIRSVIRNFNQFIDEIIPMFLIKLEEFHINIEKNFSWKEWCYIFKLGTSKIAWSVGKLAQNKESLKVLITKVSELVGRDSFSQLLHQLDLLDPPQGPDKTSCNQPESSSQVTEGGAIESLCYPPPSSESLLARRALELLSNGHKADVCFEILPSKDCEEGTKPCLLKAHQIILASRCEWFKKAFLSGMKESIDKKFVIHDTSVTIFQHFLKFIYCSHLEVGKLNIEQLAEILTLSDRFEVDSLKLLLEEVLLEHLDEDTAIFLLNIGDHFNSRMLRSSAFEYIAINKDIAKNEEFNDLLPELRLQVNEKIALLEQKEEKKRRDKVLARPPCKKKIFL